MFPAVQDSSLKQQLVQMAFARSNRDPSEEALGGVMVGVLATDAARGISQASAETSMTQVQVLQELAALGYASDSDVALAQIHASAQIQKVLAAIGERVVKHV